MRKKFKVQLLYGVSLYMDYFSIFNGCQDVDFEIIYDDELMSRLRPQYDKTYSERMKALLEQMTSGLSNVTITDNKMGGIASPLIVHPLPHALANYVRVKPHSLRPYVSTVKSEDREPYIVLNTKCITVEDRGLKEAWNQIREPLFNLFDKYNVRVKIIGEKVVSSCTEYQKHGTFSIYDDIVNGGLKFLEDETSADTVALYDLESIKKNVNILKRSQFNIHIGEGGGYVFYTHCNNLLAFTNKKVGMLDYINNPYFHHHTFNQQDFLKLAEEKIIDAANNITQG